MKMCREYSAGMRRKVGLLIAFMGHRKLVILDEPTTFLDVLTVLELKKLIREKIAEGVGIIISSHIVDFIASLLDRIVVLNDGQLQYDGKLSVLRQEVPDKTLDNIFIDLLSDKASEGMGNT
jgi:ABC-2 type transport system ATP-binding protein